MLIVEKGHFYKFIDSSPLLLLLFYRNHWKKETSEICFALATEKKRRFKNKTPQ